MTYFLCHNALPVARIWMACKRENVQRDKTPTRFDWSNSQISHCYRKVVATLWRTFRITMRSVMIINSRIFYNWFVWLLLALLFNWILLLAFYWKRVLRTMDWAMLLLAIINQSIFICPKNSIFFYHVGTLWRTRTNNPDNDYHHNRTWSRKDKTATHCPNNEAVNPANVFVSNVKELFKL